MKTFWLLGKGDSTSAICQLSLRSIEHSAGIVENMMADMEPILEEVDGKDSGDRKNDSQNGVTNYEVNGIAENGSNGSVFRHDGNTDWKCPYRKKRTEELDRAPRTTDSVSTVSSIDSKRYLQLETSNQKGAGVFKKKNTVQSATCRII